MSDLKKAAKQYEKDTQTWGLANAFQAGAAWRAENPPLWVKELYRLRSLEEFVRILTETMDCDGDAPDCDHCILSAEFLELDKLRATACDDSEQEKP